jgi:hypothetical protein
MTDEEILEAMLRNITGASVRLLSFALCSDSSLARF